MHKKNRVKHLFSCLLSIVLFSCSKNNIKADYFGLDKPSEVPTIFGENIISKKDRFEHGISFAPNGKELVFGIINKDFSGVIQYSKKVNKKWMLPQNFKPLGNESVFSPYFSPDGKTLLYAQDNSGINNGQTDIWSMKKGNDSWGCPKKIEAPLNSESREASACMTHDGTIYFSSNRNCQEKENCYTADLFYSKQTDQGYQSVYEISEFVSENDEESVFVSPKEDYIIFCRYKDKKTWMDLYISYRNHNNKWTVPQILDATINSKDWDRRPFVSLDNRFLFFTRLEFDEKGLKESDIYWVNTSKVFKPYVFRSLPNLQLKVGEQFKWSIPLDYFKDIDNKKLSLSINQNKFDWLVFDSKKMELSGMPISKGDFELNFTAIDKFSNTTHDKIKIQVKK